MIYIPPNELPYDFAYVKRDVGGKKTSRDFYLAGSRRLRIDDSEGRPLSQIHIVETDTTKFISS